jgi:hypothetical protein
MKKQIAALVRCAARRWIAVALGFCLFFLAGEAGAKTAGCPCSPCKCSPCTCGGGGGSKAKGGSDHHGKEKDHHANKHDGHGGGASVEMGVNVDLGGVGQRRREPDPFAASGGSDSTTTAHTQEGHKTKKKELEVTTTDPFTDIHLTGQLAKGITAKVDKNE